MHMLDEAGQVIGIVNGKTVLMDTASMANINGGMLNTVYPATIENMTPHILAADRIIFLTTPGLMGVGGLTAEEMALIQSQPALRAKTTFVYGSMKGIN